MGCRMYTNEDLYRLKDRIDIQDLICRLSLVGDLREAVDLSLFYTDDATIDHHSLFASPELANISVAAYRAKIAPFAQRLDAIHHQTTNFAIAIDGDQATSRSQTRATRAIGDALSIVGGTYHHRLRRMRGGWRIAYQRFDLVFTEGERFTL